MTEFAQLSRSTQRKRLKSLGQSALKAYGIADATFRFCSDTENTVFRVDTAVSTYTCRISSADPKPTNEVLGELYWLAALRQDTDLLVPEPVKTQDGRFIQEIERVGVPGQRQVVLFHWIAGRPLRAFINRKNVRQMGRVMATLHQHASQFQLPTGAERENDDWLGMGHWPKRDAHARSVLSDDDIALCEATAQKAAKIIEQVDTTQNFGLIHSDLHFYNCLYCQGAIGVIDFDDCQMAPFSNDLAITMNYIESRADGDRLRHAFLTGYEEIRPLPPHLDTEMKAFQIERSLRLIRWVLSWPSVDYQPYGRDVIAESLALCQNYL